MPGPRLLDKKVVNSEVANQKRQQIDQGINLAKKVDAIRDTLQTEESRLEIFRRESIQKVQQEIDTKIHERDVLETGNVKLREERLLAQAPIDLKLEWQQVKEDQAQLAYWKEAMTDSQLKQLARESENESLKKELESKRLEVTSKDELSDRTLAAAEEKFSKASDTLVEAKRQSEQILGSAKEIELGIRTREQQVIEREQFLSKWEQRILSHDFDLTNREKKLKSRQEIFIKAQNYLNNKK